MAGGGSLITMPLLVFMGEDGTVANGTNRVAILIQNLVATAGFAEKGFSDFKLSFLLVYVHFPAHFWVPMWVPSSEAFGSTEFWRAS